MFDLSGDVNRPYTVFTPLQMKKDRKYPLIYCFHDKDDDTFLAETYGYTKLVEPENVMCVYPKYKLEGLTDIDIQFDQIIEELLHNGYPIDEERIYVTGFFYGASAAAKLTMMRPGKLAGTGMFCGSHVFRGKILPKRIKNYAENGVKEPLICIGGKQDVYYSWPFEEESYFDTMHLWMQNVAGIKDDKVWGLEESKDLCATDSEDKVKKEFGLDFHETEIDFIEETYWYRGLFRNEEKTPMMEFYMVEGLPHIHCKMIATRIWNYLNQFKRNKETLACEFTSHHEEIQPY